MDWDSVDFEKQLVFRDLSLLSDPPDGWVVMRNRWWLVHLDKGLCYRESYRYPLCSSSRSVAQTLLDKAGGSQHPKYRILFVSIGFAALED